MKSNISRKPIQGKDSGRFAEFFLHASESRIKKVLREAAIMANKEQRKTFKRAQMKIKMK